MSWTPWMEPFCISTLTLTQQQYHLQLILMGRGLINGQLTALCTVNCREWMRMQQSRFKVALIRLDGELNEVKIKVASSTSVSQTQSWTSCSGVCNCWWTWSQIGAAEGQQSKSNFFSAFEAKRHTTCVLSLDSPDYTWAWKAKSIEEIVRAKNKRRRGAACWLESTRKRSSRRKRWRRGTESEIESFPWV